LFLGIVAVMRRWLAALVLGALLGGCGDAEPAPQAPAHDAGAGPSEAVGGGEVVVFAAASLTDAFAAVSEALAERHPELTVLYNLAGSQQLAGQLVEGAPADVFASANQRQMDVVGDAGLLAGEPAPFIANELAVAVEPGNPLGIQGLADLGRPGVTLVLAAPEVPAGQYAREALAAAGVQARPASLEQDVRAVLQRVALGEADAGIVYRSDLAAEADVEGVEIPGEQNVVATYPIAALSAAPNPDGAQVFIEFVRSDEGQAILAEHGFTPL
jgi:molybdate transport system substrate-binding protein